jgi:hypothetical protein
MSAIAIQERQLWSVADLESRWGVSRYTVMRLMKSGELESITIGARRFVPLAEVRRAEQYGVGKPRKSQKRCRSAVTTTAAQV